MTVVWKLTRLVNLETAMEPCRLSYRALVTFVHFLSIFLSSWFQVAQILPTEQNFLLQFHRESKISSVEFMKVGMQCNAQLLVGTFY